MGGVILHLQEERREEDEDGSFRIRFKPSKPSGLPAINGRHKPQAKPPPAALSPVSTSRDFDYRSRPFWVWGFLITVDHFGINLNSEENLQLRPPLILTSQVGLYQSGSEQNPGTPGAQTAVSVAAGNLKFDGGFIVG